MKRGSAGIYNLNRYLQSVLNPPAKEKKEFRHGEFIFREGDKVMQMQNNYQLENFIRFIEIINIVIKLGDKR